MVSETKILSDMCSHYKPMTDYDAPGAGHLWAPGTPLVGFIKRPTIHCYTQNLKALVFVVSEKKGTSGQRYQKKIPTPKTKVGKN